LMGTSRCIVKSVMRLLAVLMGKIFLIHTSLLCMMEVKDGERHGIGAVS